MPRKSRFHLIIVPHQDEDVKTLHFPVVILILLLAAIFFFVGFFIHNISNYTDITMLKVVKEDNERLISHIDTLQSQISTIKTKITNLKDAQKKVARLANIELYDFEKVPVPDITVDNMTDQVKYIGNIISTSIQKIETEEVPARYIPSILPVNGYIVREFGRAKDLFTGKIKQHNGINIIAPLKTPVVAPADGYVKYVGRDRFRGIYVIINHSRFYQTIYCHLLRIKVKRGKRIERGNVIGYVGKTGKAEFPNLYYEVRIEDKSVNPENFLFVRK